MRQQSLFEDPRNELDLKSPSARRLVRQALALMRAHRSLIQSAWQSRQIDESLRNRHDELGDEPSPLMIIELGLLDGGIAAFRRIRKLAARRETQLELDFDPRRRAQRREHVVTQTRLWGRR